MSETPEELEKNLKAEKTAMIWCGTIIIIGFLLLFAWHAYEPEEQMTFQNYELTHKDNG